MYKKIKGALKARNILYFEQFYTDASLMTWKQFKKQRKEKTAGRIPEWFKIITEEILDRNTNIIPKDLSKRSNIQMDDNSDLPEGTYNIYTDSSLQYINIDHIASGIAYI